MLYATGQCGSCWSFSSTGAIEGAYFLKTGKLTPLSEEQLINCVNGGSFDCSSGGDMVEAFKYVIQNKGIVSEASFPYNSKDHETCTFKPYSGSGTDPYVASITGYKTVTSNDEDALKSAVAQQPVSVAIDASQQSFQFYSSGVYDEPACCTNCQQSDLDHGVLVVGYGTEDGKDYWLVKNSWNAGWGDNGYIKMLRNADGQCGVPAYASYPIA
jgi:cathepsin L